MVAKNVDALTDGEYYYVAKKNVLMSDNCNVVKFGKNRIDLKIDNLLKCKPFEYGKILVVKVE